MILDLEQHGNGPDTYLGIHGWGGSVRTFDPVLPMMPSSSQFVSISLPGVGKSPRPQDWSLETIIDALTQTLDAIDAPQLTLVGNCSGAIFGLLTALQRPNRFKRLVLIDAFAYMPWYLKLLTLPGLGRFFYMFSFANPLGRWLTNQALRSKRAKETDMTKSFNDLDHHVTWRYLWLLSQVGSYRQFSLLKMPVDLLIGARSFAAIHRSVALWKEIWPHAQLWTLTGGGHLPLQEETERVCAILYQ